MHAREIACLIFAAGCASDEELAARVQASMTADRLAPVAACWESAFEASGFSAEYLVVVDFTVTAGGAVSAVAVRGTFDIRDGEERAAPEASELIGCVTRALERTSLGGGVGGTVHVRGFRLALRDGSRDARARASEQGPHVLIGPRSDRCQGLYRYDPPREAPVVQSELLAAEARSERASDPDARARALQQAFDLALELESRLGLDAEPEELSEEGRKRVLDERRRVRSTARSIGRRIGCRLKPYSER